MGHMLTFARVVHGTVAMLKFPGVVHDTTTPLAPCRVGQITMTLPNHASKTHFPQHP
jgi:hypothetical protein